MRPWLFISDLHLSPQRPQIIELFDAFCQEVAEGVERLYILGDFLEYWIGDDDEVAGLETAFSALSRLSQQGTGIFFMAGNRDFLVGERLAQHIGFTLLHEPHVIRYADTDILLLHGDSLCVDDVDYQQFRDQVRNPAWQRAFLDKSLDERRAIAQSMRETSRQATAAKQEYIMDVNQQAVEQTMRQHATTVLIHGHTHRPAVHRFQLDKQPAQRVVLPDWYHKGGYLLLSDPGDFTLTPYPEQSASIAMNGYHPA